MKTKTLFTFAIVLSLLASCTASQTPAPTAETLEETPLALTATPETDATPLSTLQPAPVISAVSSPYVPFSVVTNVDNLVLRANPGPLFEAKTTIPNATKLLVLGRTPGSEWLFVQTPLERTGWVFSQFITSESDLNLVPFMQPADMQIVRGRVLDENGKPVMGIQFAVVQAKAGSPPRINSITDETGTFYAFLPVNTTGTWEISFTAIACTSPLMDKDCKCLNGVCGGPTPASTSVTLPLDKSLEFVWK
ncbi:MAG: hypothetical protein QM730_26600 [Anaerolineales bacterium]